MKKPTTKSKKSEVKRFDTRIGAIEKQYGIDLGVDDDMKLGNYLKEKGYPSLSKMLQNT